MVIDTSAIIAILANEPEAPKLARAIQSDAIRLLSAANLLETAIVIEAGTAPSVGRNSMNCFKSHKSTLNR